MICGPMGDAGLYSGRTDPLFSATPARPVSVKIKNAAFPGRFRTGEVPSGFSGKERTGLFILFDGSLNMKKIAGMFVILMTVAVFAAASMAAAQTTNADSKTKTPAANVAKNAKKVVHQTICPVMGNAIDKKLFVDHEGKRIYVCCTGCLETVKADPVKYIKLMEGQGITLYKAPEKGSKKGGNSLKDKVKEPEKAK